MSILPKRIPKTPKRASRWRSQAHCNFVRSHKCSYPDCDDMPIEVAHVRIGSGAGMAQKPDDWRTVSLCRHHHSEQHMLGERSFWHAARIDVEELIKAFINASPKRAEILAEQAKRNV